LLKGNHEAVAVERRVCHGHEGLAGPEEPRVDGDELRLAGLVVQEQRPTLPIFSPSSPYAVAPITSRA
jgi:hypothetical protein